MSKNDDQTPPEVGMREIGPDETYCTSCHEFTKEEWTKLDRTEFYVVYCKHCGTIVHKRYGLDFKCPKCDRRFEHQYESRCETCNIRIIFCEDCGKYGTVRWVRIEETPSIGIKCCYCNRLLPDTLSVIKSDIYKKFRFAFKFVNRYHVAYPWYFSEQFPFGVIRKDLGSYVNDFIFADETGKEIAALLGTDYGTARGYQIAFDVDGKSEECIVLSHETGLEVFFIAAGVFIGVEAAKYSLKRILETIEKSINKWYQRTRGRRVYLPREGQDVDQPLVEKIQIRTPYWELTLDGRFTPEERDKVLTLLQENLIPHEIIEDQFCAIKDEKLERKMIGASRKVVRRFTASVDEEDG